MRAPVSAFPWAILAAQLVLAGFLAIRNLDRINPDAIGYLGAARHLLEGRFSLAVNGAWGPLYSWILVPLLALGAEPLAAARLVLVGAGLVHTAGTWRLLAALGVPAATSRPLTGAAALVASSWAGSVVTGDALLAALLVWTAAFLVEEEEPGGLWAGFAAAALGLAKPIGLPLGVCLLAGAGLARASRGPGTAAAAARGAARHLFLVGALLAPWFLALSLHYGRPTMGGSAGLNLAVGDPRLETPIHGFPSFAGPHRPAPGRLMSWEDPVELPPRPWSPLATPADRAHLVAVAGRNLATTVFHLFLMDYSGFLLLGLVLVPVWGLLSPRAPGRWHDSFLAVPALALGLGYLPFPLHTWRYEWPLVGIGLAAAGVLIERLRCPDVPEVPGSRRLLSAAAHVFGLGGPLLAGLVTFGLAVRGRPGQAADARELAALVGTRGELAALASWGPGPHQPTVATSLFTAWYLGRPWCGYVRTSAELDAALALGVRTFLVEGVPAAPSWLAEDPRLEELGARPARDAYPGLPPVVYRAFGVRSGARTWE